MLLAILLQTEDPGRMGSFWAAFCPQCETSTWPVLLAIVAGVLLLSGGLGAALSVSKGRPAGGGFLVAFLLPVVGILVIALSPRQGAPFGFRGWTRVPTTAPESACMGCGAPIHPLARRCSSCGRTLEPETESEATRVLRESKP